MVEEIPMMFCLWCGNPQILWMTLVIMFTHFSFENLIEYRQILGNLLPVAPKLKPSDSAIRRRKMSDDVIKRGPKNW